MNVNININQDRNTLKTKYPKPQQCPNNKVLYRVTFGYKSKLSGDNIFPVTYENFDDSFQKQTKILNPGDLVKYTPQNEKDPNYNRVAVITKATNVYEKREAQTRGLQVAPDKDKNSFFDIKFINPIVGANNKLIKEKKQVARLNKNNSVQLTKTVDEVESYVCEDSFIPYRDIESYIEARNAYNSNKTPQTEAVLRGTENRLWNNNFHLDNNNQPTYPLMQRLQGPLKTTLDREVENMVKVGFLLGKKEQRPQIKKSRNGFTLSFLMPSGGTPGETITIPVMKGKGKKQVMVEVVIQIPITVGQDNHTPKANEYLKDVPITQQLNSNIYDNLKKMTAKSVDTEFKPTYIRADEDFGKDTQKDLYALIKPGPTQQYFISAARIIPQDNNKFIFKKLTTFNKNSATLVFDLYVIVDLTLQLKLKGPDNPEDDSFGAKLGRNLAMGIMNGVQNCPSYMRRAKEGASQLFTTVTPRMPIAMRMRRGLAARRQATRESAANRMQRQFRRRRNIRSGRENVRRGGGRKTRKKRGGTKKIKRFQRIIKNLNAGIDYYSTQNKKIMEALARDAKAGSSGEAYDGNKAQQMWYKVRRNIESIEKALNQIEKLEKQIENEKAGYDGDTEQGGGKRKKTRKRRCHKKASRTVLKCWKRKTKKGFKKCWKKGRKTYKRCKDWKEAEKKYKSCKRKKKRTKKKRKQKGGYGVPYEHWYMQEIDN